MVFLANGTPFATNGPLVSGSITASTTSLPVGTNAMTAQYLGDGNFQPSTSAALAQVVTNCTGASTANAGPNQCLPVGTTTIQLAGSVGNGANGGTWSGGSGTFSNPRDLNAVYTPSAREIAAGSWALTLTSDPNAMWRRRDEHDESSPSSRR